MTGDHTLLRLVIKDVQSTRQHHDSKGVWTAEWLLGNCKTCRTRWTNYPAFYLSVTEDHTLLRLVIKDVQSTRQHHDYEGDRVSGLPNGSWGIAKPAVLLGR